MLFHNRKAAWTALILMQNAAHAGATSISPNPDGSIRAKMSGAWWDISVRGKNSISVTRCLVSKVAPVQRQVEARIPTSTQQFAQRGDEWNARNYQHDAYREMPANPKQNAFGDLCQKPTIQGYSEADEHSYAWSRRRRKAQRRVREEIGTPDDGSSRRFHNTRLAFQRGDLG